MCPRSQLEECCQHQALQNSSVSHWPRMSKHLMRPQKSKQQKWRLSNICYVVKLVSIVCRAKHSRFFRKSRFSPRASTQGYRNMYCKDGPLITNVCHLLPWHVYINPPLLYNFFSLHDTSNTVKHQSAARRQMRHKMGAKTNIAKWRNLHTLSKAVWANRNWSV